MKNLLEQSLDREATAPQLAAALGRYADDVAPELLAPLADRLEVFLRGIPSALSVASLYARDPVCGRAVAFALGEVLYYCFDEADLLPERDFGVLGLLDDAYFVHVFAASLRFLYAHVDISAAGYRPPDHSDFQLVRALLPAGVPDCLDRTCDNVLRVSAAFFSGGAHGLAAGPQALPVIHVGEAVRLMANNSARARGE
jgi:hypothetical protein